MFIRFMSASFGLDNQFYATPLFNRMGYKKARESVLVTRPTYQGSCIAQLSRSSNAEAHAEYVFASPF